MRDGDYPVKVPEVCKPSYIVFKDLPRQRVEIGLWKYEGDEVMDRNDVRRPLYPAREEDVRHKGVRVPVDVYSLPGDDFLYALGVLELMKRLCLPYALFLTLHRHPQEGATTPQCLGNLLSVHLPANTYKEVVAGAPFNHLLEHVERIRAYPPFKLGGVEGLTVDEHPHAFLIWAV